MLLLLNDDTNRVFDIAFRTRVGNDHGLTDGRGILPFAKTLLYYYCLNHYKIDPQMSDVRLLGDAIPEAEVADPYAAFDASDLQMPAANAKKTEDVFHLTTSKDPEGRFFIHTFATDCDAFMTTSPLRITAGQTHSRTMRKIRTMVCT